MNIKDYNDCVYEFSIVEKAIKRKNASQKYEIKQKRAKDIIYAYNKIIECSKNDLVEGDLTYRKGLREKLIDLRDRLINSLGILKYDTTDIIITKDLTQKVEFIEKNQIEDKMALTRVEYYNLCARTLNTTYSGDALALTPFLKAIKLLQTMDEATLHTDILRDYILTKLQGIAIECIPPNADVQQIMDTLSEKIKPENSKVVAGRLMALRADRSNFSDYTKKTEELAEKLNRSLVLEGIPTQKANEMTIDKTIELCRNNTTSPIVKSVLSSATFKDPKEVVAKFIIESRTETNEHNVLAFKSKRNTFNTNFNGRKTYSNMNRNTYRNNNNRKAFWNRNSNINNNNGYRNNNNNWRKRNDYRGRRDRNNWRGNRNRIFYTENQSAPPSGADQQQSVQIIQAEQSN